MPNNMFDEVLITLVENQKCLWDKSVIAYRDRMKKKKAWRDVSTAIAESEQACRRRWKSLRDRFLLELKRQQQPSGSADVPKRKWRLFEKMSFLIGTAAPKEGASSIVTDEDSMSFLFEENTCETVASSETPITPPVQKKRKVNVNNDDDNDNDNDISSDSVVVKINTLINLEAEKPKLQDPLLASIGFIFEKVPEDMQLAFKMDALTAIYAQFKALMNQ